MIVEDGNFQYFEVTDHDKETWSGVPFEKFEAGWRPIAKGKPTLLAKDKCTVVEP
jgi:hypothetical protein